MKRYPGICEFCKKEFNGYRKYQKFCKSICRIKYWKEKHPDSYNKR